MSIKNYGVELGDYSSTSILNWFGFYRFSLVSCAKALHTRKTNRGIGATQKRVISYLYLSAFHDLICSKEALCIHLKDGGLHYILRYYIFTNWIYLIRSRRGNIELKVKTYRPIEENKWKFEWLFLFKFYLTYSEETVRIFFSISDSAADVVHFKKRLCHFLSHLITNLTDFR